MRFICGFWCRSRMAAQTPIMLSSLTLYNLPTRLFLSFLATHPRRISSIVGAFCCILSTRSSHWNDRNLSGVKSRKREIELSPHMVFISLRIRSPTSWTILFLILESFMHCRAIDLRFFLPTLLPSFFKDWERWCTWALVRCFTTTYATVKPITITHEHTNILKGPNIKLINSPTQLETSQRGSPWSVSPVWIFPFSFFAVVCVHLAVLLLVTLLVEWGQLQPTIYNILINNSLSRK